MSGKMRGYFWRGARQGSGGGAYNEEQHYESRYPSQVRGRDGYMQLRQPGYDPFDPL
jgi:hypothetical protein